MGACSRLWQLMVCLVPLAVGSIICSTTNTARLSKVCTVYLYVCFSVCMSCVHVLCQMLLACGGQLSFCGTLSIANRTPHLHFSQPPAVLRLCHPVLCRAMLCAVPCHAVLCCMQSVPNNMAGTVMALDMSLSSGLRTVSPLIGTYLVQQHGFQAVCCAAAAVLLASFGAASSLGGGSKKAAGAGCSSEQQDEGELKKAR